MVKEEIRGLCCNLLMVGLGGGLMCLSGPARAEHPLLAGIVSIEKAGPRNEPVAMGDYDQILYVGSIKEGTGQGIGTQEHPSPTLQEALETAAASAQSGR